MHHRGQVVGRPLAPVVAEATIPDTLQTTFLRLAMAAMSRCHCVRSLCLDVGVAAVVEDEARVRAGIDQLGRVGQLGRPHAQVEAQARARRAGGCPATNFVSQAVAGRRARAVQHLAHALDVGVALVLA